MTITTRKIETDGNRRRGVRLVVMVSEEEAAEIERKAGHVPVSAWVRTKILDEHGAGNEESKSKKLPRNSGVLPSGRGVVGSKRSGKSVEVVGTMGTRKEATPPARCLEIVAPGLYCPDCGKNH
jgi:hypothetical protein